MIASNLPSSVITILSFLGKYCWTSAWKFSSGATLYAPSESTENVSGEAFSAPGFVGEPAIVATVVGSHVFAFIGRKSTESRNSYVLPVVGDLYFGISNVLIVVALSVESSTGYESIDKKPIPCEVFLSKNENLTSIALFVILS